MPPARLSLKCCRCLIIIDPEEDRYPYAYGDRDASKLCKKCVSALGLGKNMDTFMGALTSDNTEETDKIAEAERPSPAHKTAVNDRRRKRIWHRRGRPRTGASLHAVT
jgi:hypothetical protein